MDEKIISIFKGLFGDEYVDNTLYEIYSEDPMNFNSGVLEELRTGYMFKDIDFYIYNHDEMVAYLKRIDTDVYGLYDIDNEYILNISERSFFITGIVSYIAEMKPKISKLENVKDEDITLTVSDEIRDDDFPPFISDSNLSHAIDNSQIYSRDSKSRTYNKIINSPSVSKKMNIVYNLGMAATAMMGNEIKAHMSHAITPMTFKRIKGKHWKETQDVLDKNRIIKKAELKREIKQMKKSGKVDKETLSIMQKQYKEM